MILVSNLLHSAKLGALTGALQYLSTLEKVYSQNNDPEFMLNKHRDTLKQCMDIIEGKRDKEFLKEIENLPF